MTNEEIILIGFIFKWLCELKNKNNNNKKKNNNKNLEQRIDIKLAFKKNQLKKGADIRGIFRSLLFLDPKNELKWFGSIIYEQIKQFIYRF